MSWDFFKSTYHILHINDRLALGTIEVHVENVLIFGNTSINNWFSARETKKAALVIGISLEFKVLGIFYEIHAALTQQRMMLLTIILVLMRIR